MFFSVVAVILVLGIGVYFYRKRKASEAEEYGTPARGRDFPVQKV